MRGEAGSPEEPGCALDGEGLQGQAGAVDAKRVEIAIPMYGYKNHVGTDRRHGLIRTWIATEAARDDGAQLPSLLDASNTGSPVWADTAYRSGKNETHLAAHGFTSRIHRKKPAGKTEPKRTARARTSRNRRSAPASNMSSPGRKGRWASSSAPSALPGRP